MRDLIVRFSAPLARARGPGRLHQPSNYRQAEIAAAARQVGRRRSALHEGAGRTTPATSATGPPCCAPRSRPRRAISRRARSSRRPGWSSARWSSTSRPCSSIRPTSTPRSQLEHVHRAVRGPEAGPRRRDHRADEAEGPRRPAAAAGAQSALEPADLARVPAAGVAVLDLPRPRQGVRHQRPVRSQPARPGDRDRAQGRHRRRRRSRR